MSTHVAHLPVRRPVHLLPALRRAVSSLTLWYQRQRAVSELQALPDHLLQDIGLQRDSIGEAVDGLLNTRRAGS